jgi:hypothetical protein
MKVNITLLTMITWAARRKEPEWPGATFEGVVITERVRRPPGAAAPGGHTPNAQNPAYQGNESLGDANPAGRRGRLH